MKFVRISKVGGVGPACSSAYAGNKSTDLAAGTRAETPYFARSPYAAETYSRPSQWDRTGMLPVRSVRIIMVIGVSGVMRV